MTHILIKTLRVVSLSRPEGRNGGRWVRKHDKLLSSGTFRFRALPLSGGGCYT